MQSLVMNEWAVASTGRELQMPPSSVTLVYREWPVPWPKLLPWADGRVNAILRSRDIMSTIRCTPLVSTLQLLGYASFFFNTGKKQSVLLLLEETIPIRYICTVCNLAFISRNSTAMLCTERARPVFFTSCRAVRTLKYPPNSFLLVHILAIN